MQWAHGLAAMTSLSLREGPQFKTAFLLMQKTWEKDSNDRTSFELDFASQNQKSW